MTFREIVREDVRKVFINPDEFGTAHNVDGKNILCVLDEVNSGSSNIGRFEGLYELSHILFCNQKELPRKPVPGARMEINNLWYHVIFIEPDNFGLTEIHLKRQENRNAR